MSTVERQHELEQNSLAEWIVQMLDVIRPYLVMIIGGLVAVLAAVVAWMVISANNAAAEARSWELYLTAMSTGETSAFNEVAQRYPGSQAALWSQLVLADMAMTDGAVLAFEDRSSSTERLEAAADLYTAVLAAGPEGLLVERATFGLAKAQESLGELEAAQAGYAEVASAYPDSPLAAVAQEHADALAEGRGKEWYDWFFAQDLTPAIDPPAAAAGSPAAEGTGTSGGESDPATDALFDDGPIAPAEDAATPDGDAAVPQATPSEPTAETSEEASADSTPAAEASEPVGEAADTP